MTDARVIGRGRLAAWALGGVALLVSHDAIYLAHAGPGRALAELLRTTGHGYWGIASTVLVVAAVLAGIGASARVLRLRRRSRSLGAAPVRERGAWSRFLRTWLAYAALLAIAFAVQENIEHLAAHGHLPWGSVLIGPERPLALPVLAMVAALAATIATLLGGAERALAAGIEAALRRLARAPQRLVLRAPIRLVAAPASVLAHGGAGRAPPLPHWS